MPNPAVNGVGPSCPGGLLPTKVQLLGGGGGAAAAEYRSCNGQLSGGVWLLLYSQACLRAVSSPLGRPGFEQPKLCAAGLTGIAELSLVFSSS